MAPTFLSVPLGGSEAVEGELLEIASGVALWCCGVASSFGYDGAGVSGG